MSQDHHHWFFLSLNILCYTGPGDAADCCSTMIHDNMYCHGHKIKKIATKVTNFQTCLIYLD